MKNLQVALDKVDMTYRQLVDIANDIVKQCTADGDAIIEEATRNINNMNNDYIRDLMLRLSLNSYSFSEIKEKSAMKAECATLLQKEAYAVKFNEADGSMALRENQATLNTSEEILVNTLYNLTASLLKTKLDESHRVVDVLKTILMSRLSEAKILNSATTVGVSNEVDPTVGVRYEQVES